MVPLRLEEDTESPETGLKNDYELPREYWGPN